MKQLLRLFFILVFITSFLNAQVLKVGALPYTNIVKILSLYEPFHKFMEKELNEKVEIYTSNGYKNFFNDSKNGTFDLIITGPHFGYIHIKEGFTPLFTYNTEIRSIFVVKKDNQINSINDLRNKKISTSTYLSVSTMGGINSLAKNGLKNGEDFTLINSTSHTSAIMDVILGQSDAAITTYTPLKQLTHNEQKEKIKVIESDIAMPHLFILIHPKVKKERFEQIKQALLNFEKSEEGQTFFKKTGYKGYRVITQNDLDTLEPIISQTKSFLEEK